MLMVLAAMMTDIKTLFDVSVTILGVYLGHETHVKTLPMSETSPRAIMAIPCQKAKPMPL